MAGRAAAAARLGFAAAPLRAALTLLLAAAEGATAPGLAWAAKLLIDEVAKGPAASGARVAAVTAALGTLTLLMGCYRATAEYMAAALRRAIRLAVADLLFRRVIAYPDLRPFEDPRFQDRLRLAEQAGEQTPQAITSAGVDTVRGVVQAAGFVLTLLAVWPPMVLLVAVAAIPTTIAQLTLSRKWAGLTAGLTATMRRLIFYRRLLTESRAAKEVRIFGLGRFLHDRMIVDIGAANAAENALDRRGAWVQTWLGLAAAALAVAGVAVAAGQAFAGRLSVGDVAVFLAAVAGVQAAVAGMTTSLASGYQALILFGHFQDVVDDPPPPTGGQRAAPELRQAIEFRDVWFRYDQEGPWVLCGVDLTIAKGQTVGLVGLNGAGKSTLVKLVCGLYQPERGVITWDGIDVRDLDPATLRTRIGAVFQDFMEYDLTAAQNVGLGRVAAMDDLPAIRAAASVADVDNVLATLPRGYDTMLSCMFLPDDGDASATAMLSGGQWQRVAIARAAMRGDADLLILDEPTAGLDAEAEEEVHRRVTALRRGRTSLLISHRLSALREADRIVVLRDGLVAEDGDHAELLAAGGEYARLFRLQAEGYREIVSG